MALVWEMEFLKDFDWSGFQHAAVIPLQYFFVPPSSKLERVPSQGPRTFALRPSGVVTLGLRIMMAKG